MLRIITTYIVVLILVSLGFFSVGALASTAELSTPASLQYPDEHASISILDSWRLLAILDNRGYGARLPAASCRVGRITVPAGEDDFLTVSLKA